MEKSLECCNSAGKCHAIEKGELCNGIVKSVSEILNKIQIITFKNITLYMYILYT